MERSTLQNEAEPGCPGSVGQLPSGLGAVEGEAPLDLVWLLYRQPSLICSQFVSLSGELLRCQHQCRILLYLMGPKLSTSIRLFNLLFDYFSFQ